MTARAPINRSPLAPLSSGVMQQLNLPWVVPIIFTLVAAFSLFDFRVPILHPLVVIATCLAFAVVSVGFVRRPHPASMNAAYLAVELLSTTIILTASGGLRSPLIGLYQVFILECSMAYAQPWGVLSAALAALALALSQFLANGDFPVSEVSRLATVLTFFTVTGLLTSAQSELMNKRRLEDVQEKAHQQSSEAIVEFQMSVAREIQQSFLPHASPPSDYYDFSWKLRPQQAVGGDFAQFFEHDGAIGCVVADVTGKGVSAALLTGSLHQMVLRFGHLPPNEALTRINRLLVDTTPDGISVSIVMVKLLPDGELLYANAGHPHPLVMQARTGEVQDLPSHDLLAGWFCDTTYWQAGSATRPTPCTAIGCNRETRWCSIRMVYPIWN